ncbi:MAG: hypothetical protein U9Q79_05655, partial [Candidatus Hydrogenedentes bacterium]|nr:hypothetical protein [Candidatus Hydrogenedentota bacterium]
MPFTEFDRRKVKFYPLRERENRVFIEQDHINPDDSPRGLTEQQQRLIEETADRIVAARKCGASRMLAFGAHAIKNGLGPVMAKLIEDHWVTHLATNGAGIIHDWEFTFLGESSEHVAVNIAEGRFGMWEETGFYLNLALAVGAFEGLGYGESVGAMVEKEGLDIPTEETLVSAITSGPKGDLQKSAAAADLLFLVRQFDLTSGWMNVPHPFKQFGLQASAFRLGVPLTGHPMIGHDIIYLHPINHGAAIGRVAQRDFLAFAQGITNLTNGVYMSIGSAVMSPMVFEKSMSLAQNIALQEGKRIENHFIMVVDLAESHWNWQQGEPPEDNPD